MSRPGRIRTLTAVLAGMTALHLAALAPSATAVTCPNGNPIVQENACSGAGTTAWQLSNRNEAITGYATQSSYAKGQDVALKIARGTSTFPATAVAISVYRFGYYGGTGGRLIAAAGASSVTVNNAITCQSPDRTTGKLDCGNWAVTYTIPGSALPASGVYLAKLRTTDTGYENSIVFTVRDDARPVPSAVQFVVPTATYQAYNNWGGKSLYFDSGSGQGSGFTTIASSDRAVKVSFNRPTNAPEQYLNRFVNGPDRSIVFWLEQQGYDVAYTDDYAVHANPAALRDHRVVVLGAHAEYWSGEEMAAYKAARDAGTSILSLGSNTGYWKVRFEDGGRTLVCYKTVQGTGTSGSGTLGVNDWGPDAVQGTTDDALGLDGRAGTADDHPENATTTFRDNGAPPGDPNAPPAGRVGPDAPENSLLGNMYVGDNDSFNYPLVVPAGDASGQYAADRIWRNTGISTTSSTTLDSTAVGWEWDAVPTQAQYLAKQPAGVVRLTNSATGSQSPNWVQDEGRVYAGSPPPGQPASVQAVKYRAGSGAWVFAAGTNDWGLALDVVRVGQATYNMLSDMGVQPATPDASIKLDTGGTPANQPPAASFTGSPASPVPTGTTVAFDASASSDPDGTIARYEWDLDGNGTYERDTGTTPTTTTTFATAGSFDVRLRVTDNAGATASAVRTYVVNAPTPANQPPTASVTAAPNPAQTGQAVTFDARASSDSDGTIARYEWDLDGNGTYERDTGTTATTTASYSAAATLTIRLRVTDDAGATATASTTLTIQASSPPPPTTSTYATTILGTSGLAAYWRLGEPSGTALADGSGNGRTATLTAGLLGVPGALAGDPDTAVRFNGTTAWARAPMNLSATRTVTVEFWLERDAYANNDALALEHTSNSTANAGGFFVNPNAANGSFGAGLGKSNSRNNVYFSRPSAGQWHHYAIVFDTTAPAAQQVTPYVDGAPVAYVKQSSSTGATTFANATLYFMSRGGSSLFSPGDLDEVAIYTRRLTASEISAQAAAGR